MSKGGSFINYIKSRFRVVVVDAEFQFDKSKSYPNKVLCIVYRDLSTGETFRVWEEGQETYGNRPFDFDTTLFVCFVATAEVGCFLKQHYGRPPWIFDCWTEYSKLYKNRRELSVLAACTAYGYPNPMSKEEKDYWRDKIIHQDSWTREEQLDIMNYCEKDVDETEHIFYELLKDLEKHCGNDYEILLEQALARGQYMACLQKMHANGVPIDRKLVDDFNNYWVLVKRSVIEKLNKKLNIFTSEGVFSEDLFGKLLRKLCIYEDWPRTPTGKLKTNIDTLELFKSYREIKLYARIKSLTDKAKLAEYIVSEDGRIRPYDGFKPFRSHTSRNQPTSKWIFGTAKWGRNLIRPPYGSAVVYCDYAAEEVYVAARLSGDERLMAAYNTGDPYIAMAQVAGIAPQGASKKSHPVERLVFKILNLASNYMMGARSVARDLKQHGYTKSQSGALLKEYKERHHKYFEWNKRIRNSAALFGVISTCLGWDRRFPENKRVKATSLANWPIQSESAEIMRNASIRLTDAGIKVLSPVHDAFLIECPIPELEDQIRIAKQCMVDAANYIMLMADAPKIKNATQIRVEHEIHYDNFTQDKADQEIFDLIFKEIENYKRTTTIKAKPYETSRTSLYV